MSFGFRVGVPGMRVRVSTRGVRASVGPRAARISAGSGGARISSGLGPLYASSSLSGGTRRRTTNRRTAGPSAAQLERARRQVERAEHDAQRDAVIKQLHQFRHDSTTVHLQTFPQARPPVIDAPPTLTLPWALDAAREFHLQGLSRLARGERATAKHHATLDAPAYLAAEAARLQQVHHTLTGEARQWWQALISNDEYTVCEAVNTAFSDNPAAGCAVGLEGNVMSVVMRHQDLDSMPTQRPTLTPAGRPTLKNLAQRDRMLWWFTSLASNVVATLKEGFATAPGVDAIDLAVLTRLPSTQQLGFVLYGRWTRHVITTAPWQTSQDVARFLDIGQDVACSVTFTPAGNLSTSLKPLTASRAPGLQDLLDSLQEESHPDTSATGRLDLSLADHHDPTTQAPSLPDPYQPRSFTEWKTAARPATPIPPLPTPQATPNRPTGPSPSHPTPLAPTRHATPLIAGQTTLLPPGCGQGFQVSFECERADADLTIFLVDDTRHVASDADFIYYNQHVSPTGAVRLLGKRPNGAGTCESAAIHLDALPEHVKRVVIASNPDIHGGLTFSALGHVELRVDTTTGTAWTFQPAPDHTVRAMILVEIYRHQNNNNPRWKLRAVGQGWASGLPGLARAHGVDIK